MKRKEFTDLKNKTLKDLTKFIIEKKAEALLKKMGSVSGKEKNLKSYRNLRREIAQVMTLIKEKQIMEKLAGNEEVKAKSEKSKV